MTCFVEGCTHTDDGGDAIMAFHCNAVRSCNKEQQPTFAINPHIEEDMTTHNVLNIIVTGSGIVPLPKDKKEKLD